MNINLIVCYANNLVIGNDKNDYNELFDEEYDYINYFSKIITEKSCSKKNIVIIGNKTYENTHIPLRNTLMELVESNDIILIVIKNITDSEKIYENGVYFVDSLGGCMDLCNELYSDSTNTIENVFSNTIENVFSNTIENVFSNTIENVFFAGGESIFTYYLTSYYYKLLNKVYITRINKDIEGNKRFYGLEGKFYYKSIDKKGDYIENRVLQYDSNFQNGEELYLNFIRESLKSYHKFGYNSSSRFFEMNIDLTKYFPVFSMFKANINDILKKAFMSMMRESKISNVMNDIINCIKGDKNNNVILNLDDISPFYSIYTFSLDENNLSCNVIHQKGNILNEVFINIIFTSLLVHLLCHMNGYKDGNETMLIPSLINYKCLETTYNDSQIYFMETVAWNTPDVLSIIKISDRKQECLSDFIFEDIELLGCNI
jgi:dihydrofolate reductase